MICRRASICFSLLCVQLGFTVSETVHVPGVENIICDGLSRGKEGGELGLPVERYSEFTHDEDGVAFLHECNPLEPIGGVSEHVVWLEQLLSLLSTFQ